MLNSQGGDLLGGHFVRDKSVLVTLSKDDSTKYKTLLKDFVGYFY